MKKSKLMLVVLAGLSVVTVAAMAQRPPSAKSQDRITREVRHELLMLPYFGVFDNIAYKVDGETVTLYGDVVRPVLKSDAENAVKRIEGVEHVDNKIEVLPPRPRTTAFALHCSVLSTNILLWRNTNWACRSQSVSL